MDGNEKFVNDMVDTYLKYMRRKGYIVTCEDIVQVFSNSASLTMGLPVTRRSGIYPGVVSVLSKVMRKYNVADMSREYRLGLLEACTMCLKMSKERVLSGEVV